MPKLPAKKTPKPRPDKTRLALGLTLIDVAKVAGVSPITVSRALSRPELVSEQTLEKVRRAVADVGYTPNMLAGGLASKQSKLVAVFVPTIAHSIFSDMVQTLMDQLGNAGYQSIIGVTGYSVEKEESLLGAILGRRPDAIVLTGTEHSALTRQRLVASGIPVVEAWDLCEDPIDILVGFSHSAVGKAVARHLLGRGYRRFAVVSVSDARAVKRSVGLVDELSVQGVTDVRQVIYPAPATLKEGRDGLSQLLREGTLPEVVVCSSDTVAQGVLAEAASRGLRVPEDVAVMGFGDLSSAAQLYPALSSVRLDGARIGSLIASTLLERLQKQRDGQAPVRIDTGFDVINRVST
ncbi:LacI family DNA-binding transcriptional regulator [Marinobacterium rhizophilum]|uniref:LacI family DNA-binding transcriptional regulator n=1 Tax=Marinobacterium rhizophilum TaxID=420402 RepID=A0ABY5HGJ5_9GAMM|nr:LacI family DNA-binding transcriptional regulator [Marinobacterium rhizophilum]UTW11490.1 LacI family DNA-binding transcriptional regulator [Marinobacterium rhizophilum]